MIKLARILDGIGFAVVIAGCSIMESMHFIIPTAICIGGLLTILVGAELEDACIREDE